MTHRTLPEIKLTTGREARVKARRDLASGDRGGATYWAIHTSQEHLLFEAGILERELIIAKVLALLEKADG